MEISGRRVLVTGASRGIGRGLAEAFAAAGARVALVARSGGPLAELAGRLDGRAYPADLADPSAVEDLVARVEADGAIDVLVNNAGISRIDYVLSHTVADIEAIFRTNLLTPVHLCRQLIPRMLERGGGHIVNVASLAAVMAAPGLVHYGASKAGLAHYTAGLRTDLRGLPIGITLVQIGSTATELDDATQQYAPYRALRGRRSARDVQMPPERVVAAIVEAVRRDRRSVVLPRPMSLLTGLVELPRRLTELAFRRVDPRPPPHEASSAAQRGEAERRPLG